jgi:hypothetical protein
MRSSSNMSRSFGFIATALAMMALLAVSRGQDNPVLRERLEQKIVEDLSQHCSQETAWYNEKSVDKQKWTEGKVVGRKIRLASWTEQSKTWLWLEDPQSTLSLDLQRLALRDGRLEFALTAKAKARFKAWGRIPKLAQASVGGNVVLAIEIDGSAAIGDGQLHDGKITKLRLQLDDLRFNKKAAHPVEGLLEDAVNDYVDDKNEKLRRSIEKAINRVHF